MPGTIKHTRAAISADSTLINALVCDHTALVPVGEHVSPRGALGGSGLQGGGGDGWW